MAVRERKRDGAKAGEWVLLRNDEIVEHDSNVEKILALAKKYNDDEITVSKIPSAKYCFY